MDRPTATDEDGQIPSGMQKERTRWSRMIILWVYARECVAVNVMVSEKDVSRTGGDPTTKTVNFLLACRKKGLAGVA